MNAEEKELLYDLLTKQVIYGLDADEQAELDKFDPAVVDAEFRSLEIAAAAISMASLEVEPMPEHLAARILENAPSAIINPSTEKTEANAPVFTADDVFRKKGRPSIMSWLGWGFAAVLLVVLGLDVYHDRIEPRMEEAKAVQQPSPQPSKAPPSPAEQREQMMRTAPDMVSASWVPGNVKDMQVSGDIVWSDSKQTGYMRFHGLPANDPSKATYQLWIFDQTQDKATPIDGGTFNVDANGEVVVPINPKLHAVKPVMFAVTMEKPGGVVVSKREKIAALAKVETQKT